MDPRQASTAQLIPKVWDALIDPVIGYLSDKTRSRFGRRRPWLLGAAVPAGIFFFMVWWFPAENPDSWLAYFLVIYCLQRTSYTSYMVPYAALTMELSPKESDRNTLTSYRFFFGGVGNLICVALFGAIPNRVLGGSQTGTPEEFRQAYMSAALFVAIIVTVSILACFFLAKEKDFKMIAKDNQSLPFKQGFITMITNRSFMILTGMTALMFLSLQMVQSNMLQFFVYTMGLTKVDASNCILVTLAMLIVFVPLIRLALNRVTKKLMWFIGCVVFGGFCLAAWLAPGAVFISPTLPPLYDLGYAYFLAAFFGLVLSIMFYLPWTMIPDCIDTDELNTGVRREGLHYAVYIFFEKVASGIGLSLAGYILDQKGYNPANPASNFVLADTYRQIISLVAFCIMIFSCVLLLFYPITSQRRFEIQAELLERRKTGNGERDSML